MTQRKIAYTLGVLLLITLPLSCKKERTTVINITMKMAHTGEPIGGSGFYLVEYKTSGIVGDLEETGWSISGIIPAHGSFFTSFNADKNKTYYLTFDHSTMNVPPGDYEIVQGPSGFVGNITKGEVHTYDIRVLPYMNVVIHYKNTDCYDEADSFKFKSRNIDEKPNTTLSDINGLNWVENSIYNGCSDWYGGGEILAGHYVYVWEATRNGILESGIDTFYVAPGVNDSINLFW